MAVRGSRPIGSLVHGFQFDVSNWENPLDEKIRKRAQSTISEPYKRPRCQNPCSMNPGDLWQVLSKEKDETKLSLQLQAMVCEDLFYALQNHPLPHLYQPTEKLLTSYAKVYCTKAEQISDDALIALFNLDTSLFSDPNATINAYLIKHLKERKDCAAHSDQIRKRMAQLRPSLTPDCIHKFIHILNTLSADTLVGPPLYQLKNQLENLKNNLIDYLRDEALHPQGTTHVLEAIVEITYILKNGQLSAAIILATRYPQLEDRYLSLLANRVPIPTHYHFIEALYSRASLRVCERLQDHSRIEGKALGLKHDLGFQDYQLSYALSLHSPLPIVKLIPLNPNLPIYYLEEAIKARCSAEVISYLLDEALRLQPVIDPSSSYGDHQKQEVNLKKYAGQIFQAFQLALEHNAPFAAIQRFVHNAGVRPNHNSLYYAFKRSPLTRDIVELLVHLGNDIRWHELVNYLIRAMNDKLSTDIILFLLDKVIRTEPSKISSHSSWDMQERQRKENRATLAKELTHCFDQAMIQGMPLQVVQAFIQQGIVKPTVSHIFSRLNSDAPDPQIITLLCKSVKPGEISSYLRAKAQQKGISLPHFEDVSQDPFIDD